MSKVQRQHSVFQSAPAESASVPERLLAAAMDLVKSDGLQGLSQARVAAAAGLRQSHLTYYFPTRKDLIKALVQSIQEEMKSALDSVAPVRGNGAMSVDQARDFLAQRLREPLMARLMLALMNAADEAPSLRCWLAEFDAELIERLREIFARLGLRPSPEELDLLHASFVGAAILGAQATQDADAGICRTERLVRLAFDRLVERMEFEDGGLAEVDLRGRGA